MSGGSKLTGGPFCLPRPFPRRSFCLGGSEAGGLPRASKVTEVTEVTEAIEVTEVTEVTGVARVTEVTEAT